MAARARRRWPPAARPTARGRSVARSSTRAARAPRPRGVERLERTRGVARSVLRGAEQRLDEGVVVADAGPRERRHDSELLQRGEHRGALHRATVVRVQDEPFGIESQLGADLSEQLRRGLVRLLLEHGPAHDLATPHVEEEVQVVEHPGDGAAQVGDVPAPHLVGTRGLVLGGSSMRARLGTTAMSVELLRAQQPVQRRLRGEVDLHVGQLRHDLVGGEIDELARDQQLAQFLGFGLGELVGGRNSRPLAAILSSFWPLSEPSLHGADVELHDLAAPLEPSPSGARLVDQLDDHPTLFDYVSSSSSANNASNFFGSSEESVSDRGLG